MAHPTSHTILSIIIPTKDEEEQLPGCLETVQEQDIHLPWELIVVDSSSTPISQEIAKKYGARVIIEQRLGKGIAVYTGAEAAKGEILCFTEADCRLPEDWLQNIYNEFSNDPDTVAVTAHYDYFDSGWLYNLILDIFLPISVWGYYLIYRNHSIRGTNFAVRASAYQQAGKFSLEAKEFQDVELGLRLRRLGKIRFVRRLKILTSSRRIRGRIFEYLLEFAPAIYKLFVQHRLVTKATYKDIR